MPEFSAYKSFPHLVIQPQIRILSGKGKGAGGEHCAGPVYPDFEQQGDARHWRKQVPIDECPPMPEPEEILDLDEDFTYGGCIFHHFGHFMAEFLHRLLPSLRAFPQLRVIYMVRPGAASEPLPRFVQQAFEYLGLPLGQIFLVDRPIRVRCLHVFAQQEMLGGLPTEPEYLAALEGRQRQAFPISPEVSPQVLYVSRSRQAKGFAGERVLDDMFAAAGARIFFPEEHSIREQLVAYQSHAKLLFSEGSALHGLQLLGRVPAEVMVLARRPRQLGKNFLSPRVKGLDYFRIMDGSVMYRKPNGIMVSWTALIFLNRDKLGMFCERYFPDWAPAERERAVSHALEQLTDAEKLSVAGYLDALPPRVRRLQGAEVIAQLEALGKFSSEQLAEWSQRYFSGAKPKASSTTPPAGNPAKAAKAAGKKKKKAVA